MAVVCIAGAGGIGSAVAVLLRQMYGKPVDVFIGDINGDACRKAVDWIAKAGSADGVLRTLICRVIGKQGEQQGLSIDIVLDCLPGALHLRWHVQPFVLEHTMST